MPGNIGDPHVSFVVNFQTMWHIESFFVLQMLYTSSNKQFFLHEIKFAYMLAPNCFKIFPVRVSTLVIVFSKIFWYFCELNTPFESNELFFVEINIMLTNLTSNWWVMFMKEIKFYSYAHLRAARWNIVTEFELDCTQMPPICPTWTSLEGQFLSKLYCLSKKHINKLCICYFSMRLYYRGTQYFYHDRGYIGHNGAEGGIFRAKWGRMKYI